jgi:capsular polysaccharide transport system permease protein
MEADALATAHTEVDFAIQKVSAASEALTRFRGSHSSMNPVAESQAQFSVVSILEQRITEVQAELAEKRAFMRDDSAEVISLRNRVNALTRQLRLEKAKLLGGADGKSSDLIADYQPLELAQQLAQQQYASALGSLEMARLEAQRKKLYLVTFIEPSLPDEAVEPRRLIDTLTVSIFSFILFLIGGLMWSALQDHIGK